MDLVSNLDEQSIDLLFLDKWWCILLENVGTPRSAILKTLDMMVIPSGYDQQFAMENHHLKKR